MEQTWVKRGGLCALLRCYSSARGHRLSHCLPDLPLMQIPTEDALRWWHSSGSRKGCFVHRTEWFDFQCQTGIFCAPGETSHQSTSTLRSWTTKKKKKKGPQFIQRDFCFPCNFSKLSAKNRVEIKALRWCCVSCLSFIIQFCFDCIINALSFYFWWFSHDAGRCLKTQEHTDWSFSLQHTDTRLRLFKYGYRNIFIVTWWVCTQDLWYGFKSSYSAVS